MHVSIGVGFLSRSLTKQRFLKSRSSFNLLDSSTAPKLINFSTPQLLNSSTQLSKMLHISQYESESINQLKSQVCLEGFFHGRHSQSSFAVITSQ
jgi:hypothetical protein